jgi:polyisoprenoid-binding protein YceI
MKKASYLLGFAIFALFIFSNSGVEAVKPTIAEKFANAGGGEDTDYSGSYSFDKNHSAISFRVRHMGLVDVIGFFRDFTGTINYNAKDMSKSTVEFTAQATSVDTGVGPRDTHLRSGDFFEVDKFKEITFKSTKVDASGKALMVTGDFTMKGVTKSITFPVNVAGFLPGNERGGPKMGATAKTVLNRRDYGVNFGGNLPNGSPVLSDEVQIDLQIEANSPKPATPAATPATPKQ